MAFSDARARYFEAWNRHDPDAILAALTDDGTYEDPMTEGPLTGDALAAYCGGLFAGFPDVHFDVFDEVETTPTTASARWRMIGTNTGATPQGPPTGGT